MIFNRVENCYVGLYWKFYECSQELLNFIDGVKVIQVCEWSWGC